MSQYNKNVAYDLSKIKNKSRSKIIDINLSKTKRVRDFKLKFTIGLYVFGLSLFAIIGIFLFLCGQVKLAEINAKISEISKQINESENKYSENTVKDFTAKSNKTKSKIYCLSEHDKVEIFDE
ncbi:MAG: hypothetical protein LBJ32_04895 [Oscillospiraceae bacterium]|nr:hypothetical protein [Oscillospiraceae bacterium]